MRIEHLRECVDLAQSRSFTQTAERFFVTQPVLSKHIAAIERELGATLFVRDKRSVDVTEAGAIFVAGAREAIGTYDAALKSVSALSDKERGILSVGYLAGAARPFLSVASALFGKDNPEVDVRFTPLSIQEMAQALVDDAFDLVITTDTFELPTDYRTMSIYTDRYCVIVSPSNPLALRESVPASELAGTPVHLLNDDLFPRESRRVRKFLRSVGIEQELQAGLSDIEQFPLVVASGREVAVTLGHIRHYFGNALAVVPFAEDAPEAIIEAAWNERKRSNGDVIEWFCRAITESIHVLNGM